MNERIQELARQATTPGYMLGESYVQSRLDEQKFAELIVQECLMKAHGAKIRGESMDELIERLKEDFGVEE